MFMYEGFEFSFLNTIFGEIYMDIFSSRSWIEIDFLLPTKNKLNPLRLTLN